MIKLLKDIQSTYNKIEFLNNYIRNNDEKSDVELRYAKHQQVLLENKFNSYFSKFDKTIFEEVELKELYLFKEKWCKYFTVDYVDDITKYIRMREIREFGCTPHYPFLNEFEWLTDEEKYEIDNDFYHLPINHPMLLGEHVDFLRCNRSMYKIPKFKFKEIFKRFYEEGYININYVFECEEKYFYDYEGFSLICESPIIDVIDNHLNWFCCTCSNRKDCHDFLDFKHDVHHQVMRLIQDPWDIPIKQIYFIKIKKQFKCY